MPDWRDEVGTALDFWIATIGGSRSERLICVGRARREAERGWYLVDVRGSDRTRADPDQVDSLRLSGRNGPASGASYPVMEAVQDGSALRIRVAEFVDCGEPHLWQYRQPATYLLTKLREGIAKVPGTGMAHDLAAGRLTPAPPVVGQVAGFTPAQQEAYESCLSSGIRLVWGPPGTGKTRVLAEAISTLVAAGKRVLLVSATNIAVDNALLGVAVSGRHQPGELLRVGPPHHPDVLKYPHMCLPHLVREQLTEVEAQRRAVEQRLVHLRLADEELARLQELVGAFDEEQYRRVKRLLAVEAEIPALTDALAAARATAQAPREEAARLQDEQATAHRHVQDLAPTKAAYAQIDRLQHELTQLAAAADERGSQALIAGHAADTIGAEIKQLETGGALARLWRRGQIKHRRAALAAARQWADELQRQAQDARQLWQRRWSAAQEQAGRLAATAPCSRSACDAADTALAAATQARTRAEARIRRAEAEVDRARQALHAAEAADRPTSHERAMVDDAERRDLLALAGRAARLRAGIAASAPERTRLEQEHAGIQEKFDRLRRDAEGEIIGRARVVATTLARLRTTPALEGPFDVVLVDEVGAANLPEVLLAVSRAQRAAVLLGDFMQLGAVVEQSVRSAQRPDVQRWLAPDVFVHCGITTPAAAQAHAGCTALDTQHRFGPQIMDLANTVAYDGLLKPGPNVRAHADGDPEIVLIDTDGLDDIGRVRAVGRSKGWWPAGALLSRVLADYHRARGERTGVVTPYGLQVEATLEAFRDQETSGTPVTEVGTAHRFQGREFPIVIFDLVEDEHQQRWMARASRQRGTWERDGMRLFNVAITRTQTRLYLIGSRTLISAARPDTPLAHLAMLLSQRRATAVRATQLIDAAAVTHPDRPLGPVSNEWSQILAQHVRVAAIQDERDFYQALAEHVDKARDSIWMWAPWTTGRVTSLLPLLTSAVDRGVTITLFVRDPGDHLQGRPAHQRHLADLRAVLHTVVEVNAMHQKIIILDEETVLLGSLNALSQSHTREVMVTVHGGHFARKLLEHEHARDFAAPPRCGACQGTQIDLRRDRKGQWTWRCYATNCPAWSPTGRNHWTRPVFDQKAKDSAGPAGGA